MPVSVPVPIVPPKPTMRKGQFILDGIIITKDKNIALLREVATRKMVRAELGQEINGMQIEKLDRDKITFKQGDEHEEVILKIKTVTRPAGNYGKPGVPAQLAAPVANCRGHQLQFRLRTLLIHGQCLNVAAHCENNRRSNENFYSSSGFVLGNHSIYVR